MSDIELDIRNHKIIEKSGLAFAFNSLCNYICEEDLYEWQNAMAEEYDIDFYDENK